jgi:hypothetical protein
VPLWVASAEKRIPRTSSSLVDKYVFLKGRHFEYRLSFGGQGGSIVKVERRKRAKRIKRG